MSNMHVSDMRFMVVRYINGDKCANPAHVGYTPEDAVHKFLTDSEYPGGWASASEKDGSNYYACEPIIKSLLGALRIDDAQKTVREMHKFVEAAK